MRLPCHTNRQLFSKHLTSSAFTSLPPSLFSANQSNTLLCKWPLCSMLLSLLWPVCYRIFAGKGGRFSSYTICLHFIKKEVGTFNFLGGTRFYSCLKGYWFFSFKVVSTLSLVRNKQRQKVRERGGKHYKNFRSDSNQWLVFKLNVPHSIQSVVLPLGYWLSDVKLS